MTNKDHLDMEMYSQEVLNQAKILALKDDFRREFVRSDMSRDEREN